MLNIVGHVTCKAIRCSWNGYDEYLSQRFSKLAQKVTSVQMAVIRWKRPKTLESPLILGLGQFAHNTLSHWKWTLAYLMFSFHWSGRERLSRNSNVPIFIPAESKMTSRRPCASPVVEDGQWGRWNERVMSSMGTRTGDADEVKATESWVYMFVQASEVLWI